MDPTPQAQLVPVIVYGKHEHIMLSYSLAAAIFSLFNQELRSNGQIRPLDAGNKDITSGSAAVLTFSVVCPL